MLVEITSETSSDGVVEHGFTVGDVPGVLWSPTPTGSSATTATPLLLLGHGGGLHKRAPGLVARARRAVTIDGFRAAAIDAPGHGDRPRSAPDQRRVEQLTQARDRGEPLAPIVAELNHALADRAVPEWRRVIDALLTRPGIGPDTPVGYSGMTLATTIGIRLAAAEPRVQAAIFGGAFADDALLQAARQVTIPVEYLLPWDDEEIDRESGLALFDAFATRDKTLHAFPGSHFRVPAERIDTRFFARQLGGPRGG